MDWGGDIEDEEVLDAFKSKGNWTCRWVDVGDREGGNWNQVCATVCLVMPLTKMGKLKGEQVEKGNQRFCSGLFKFKMSTDISKRR